MKGVVALLLFAFLASLVFTVHASIEQRNEEMRSAILVAAEQKRTFYAARDIEATFWETVKLAIRKSADNCKTNCSGLLEKTLHEDLLRWESYVEDYPEDVNVSVLGGKLDRATMELKDASPLESFPLLVFEMPKGEFRIFSVYIMETGSTNGVFATIRGNRTETLALLPAGSFWSCIDVTVTGENLPLC